MTIRKVIEVRGASHLNSIPTAVKIGNMVYSSAVMGADPKSGKIPPTIEKEVSFIFVYLQEIVEKAGWSCDHIAHLSVRVAKIEYRAAVNVEWLKMFPNPDDRPARHTSVQALKAGVRVQIEMTAVLS